MERIDRAMAVRIQAALDHDLAEARDWIESHTSVHDALGDMLMTSEHYRSSDDPKMRAIALFISVGLRHTVLACCEVE